MATPDPTPLALRLERPLDAEGAGQLVRDRLGLALAAYLPGRRWYGDKDRPLASVAIPDVAVTEVAGAWFALTVLDVGFGDGGDPARYFIPLAVVADGAGPEAPLAVIEAPPERWRVVEAVAAPGFPAWLLDQFAAEAALSGRHGRFRWRRFPALGQRLAAARAGPSRVGGAEQSNSAVLYDEAVFVKVFRRLRAGINPDEEVSRFLAERTDFRRLPLPLGSAAYVAADGSRFPAALALSFVQNAGDGWSWTLASLAAPASSPDPYVAAARLLGERTGQLHLALASDDDDPAFAPEPVTEADVAAWERGAVAALRSAAAALRAGAAAFPVSLQRRSIDLSDRLPAIAARASGFRALLGSHKTRVHGDYHLGQVLRTADADWVLLDFEGEPARPIAERRTKTSPVKDVAGMLRSFGYARGAAGRAAGVARDDATDRLTAWEAEARAAFLAGYRAETVHAPIPLVPTDESAFTEAVAAWELDKALYEVGYELGNRPDWLDLPLDALLRD